MTLGAPRIFTLGSGSIPFLQNGQGTTFMGRGDGVNGWKPTSGIQFPVKLVRLYAKCYHQTNSSSPASLDVTVWNGGIETAGGASPTWTTYDVFHWSLDISSGSGSWYDASDTTAGNASQLVTVSSGFVIVNAQLNGHASGRVNDVSFVLEAMRLSE